MYSLPSVLLLGIGNVLWADEGFGVRVVESLQTHYEFPDNVTIMDGGTQGIYLVQHIQAADILVVFDAIDYGLAPASLKTIENQSVPKYLGAKKMSLHQTGFQEVLALAEILGNYPEHLLLVGVQPVELEDYGGSLRPEIRAQIHPAITKALEYLRRFDVYSIQKQKTDLTLKTRETDAIGLERYESERPSAMAACRKGDGRVVLSHEYEIRYQPTPVENDRLSVDVDYRGKY